MVTTAGELEADRLQAAIDLAGDIHLAIADHHLRGKRALAPAQKRRKHLSGLVAIIVDGLLAKNDQPRRFGERDGFQKFGDGERFDRLIRLDENAAIGAHRKPASDRLGRLRRPDRHDNHLNGLARLFRGAKPPRRRFRRRGSSTF